MDDYEELNTTPDAPRSRAMSLLILVVALGGFVGLAYYAYHSGAQSVSKGDMVVVQADDAPIKQVPSDPEGEQFANKDKTIYDVISPAGGAHDTGEKLLPDPEQPVAVRDARDAEDTDDHVQPMPPSTTTYVNKKLSAVEPVEEKPLKPAATTTPAPSPTPVKKVEILAAAPVVAPAPAVKVETPVVTAPAAVKPAASAPQATPAKPVQTADAAPTMVNESPVASHKDAEKAAPTEKAKPATKKPAPVKEATKKPAATGAYKVQLGAYQSEAEAQANWKKISGKFAGVLSGGPTIVKAELDNGTFYRLRAGGFATSDAAKAACAKLSAKGQGCFIVK